MQSFKKFCDSHRSLFQGYFCVHHKAFVLVLFHLYYLTCFQNGETAMHIAARYGQLQMIGALLDEGGDPTQQSRVC